MQSGDVLRAPHKNLPLIADVSLSMTSLFVLSKYMYTFGKHNLTTKKWDFEDNLCVSNKLMEQ